jgi:hypothetical protein
MAGEGKMKSQTHLVFILCLFLPLFSKANLGTQTLPEGINSPSLRMGFISKLDEKYTQKGSLGRSVDQRSIELDAKKLSQLAPQVQALVDLFNQFGYGFGDQIHMGSLKIESKPEIQYTGVVFGRGITDRLTIGAGVPIIHYKNQIKLWQTQNNLSVYKEQAQAIGNNDLINGVNQLAGTNVPQVLQSELRRKGYEELKDQDQTFVGDVQVSALYDLRSRAPFESQFRMNVSLPTGPKYNPDNLAALNQFGVTYLEPQGIMASKIGSSNFKVTGSLAFRWHMPDQISIRVPKNENDILPDADQKEDVRRQLGNKFTESAQLGYDLSEIINLFGLSEWSQKAADKYEGSKSGNYDLLSKDSDTETQVVTAGLSYSSVEKYMRTKSGIPMVLTAQVSDTISGKNTERQLVQEVSAVIFF